MRRIGMCLSVFVVGCIGTGCASLNPVGSMFAQVGTALGKAAEKADWEDIVAQADAEFDEPGVATEVCVVGRVYAKGMKGKMTAGGKASGRMNAETKAALMKQLEDAATTPEQKAALLKILFPEAATAVKSEAGGK